MAGFYGCRMKGFRKNGAFFQWTNSGRRGKMINKYKSISQKIEIRCTGKDNSGEGRDGVTKDDGLGFRGTDTVSEV